MSFLLQSERHGAAEGNPGMADLISKLLRMSLPEDQVSKNGIVVVTLCMNTYVREYNIQWKWCTFAHTL